MSNKVGAVLVVGGGVAGMQAALDLAGSGYYVHLVEKSSAIGGIMSQLDKTFPTNDCAMCILSPKLVEVGRHPNIKLHTLTEVKEVNGIEGNFTVKLLNHPRYIDMSKCIACGECAAKCPSKVTDAYNEGLVKRKAIYVKYSQAVPLKYAIDAENCNFLAKGKKCKVCEKKCPSHAINFDEKETEIDINVGSIILAPGFKPYAPKLGDNIYGYHNLPNVVTSIEFERILSASGPSMGHLIRPSDNKEPKKIAWLQCVGSRNINKCDNAYCSSVCCMYAIKEAYIAKEHSKEPLETTIFYMDMRTHGKDFDKSMEKAKEAGVKFQRSRIHSIDGIVGSDDLRLTYITDDGKRVTETFDIVVLSVGLEMPPETIALADKFSIKLNSYNFNEAQTFNPVSTSKGGVYACGVFNGPKDIPVTVMEASAAACAASSNLSEVRDTLTIEKNKPSIRDIAGEPPRIGVFVCNCGINISGVILVPQVVEYARTLPGVEVASDAMFSCSQDVQESFISMIKEHNLNRVIVAACSPRTHEPLFQETLETSGLNKFLFEMVNIRNQGSWVHSNAPEDATEKAKNLIRMAVAKSRLLAPLSQSLLPVNKKSLVIGGGIAGMTAAKYLAMQGYEVELIEKSDRLGGQALRLHSTSMNEDISAYIKTLKDEIDNEHKIKVHYNSAIKHVDGFVGNFKTIIVNNALNEDQTIEHGVAIIATGAHESKPTEYLYGDHPMVKTHLEFDEFLKSSEQDVKKMKNVVFIQCVGSRTKERPYCSKVCCTHTVHSAVVLKKKNPDLNIYVINRDIRTYALKEDIYKEARDLGVIFVRYSVDNKPKVQRVGENLKVTFRDKILDMDLTLKADMVVLASAIVSNNDKELAQLFKVPLDEDGWFFEAHQKLRPVDFATDGIFLCGLAHYPKPIDESIAQAMAAASRALVILSMDSIVVGGVVSSVNKRKCVGCGVCVSVCAYSAITIDEKNCSTINEALCKGCGACVSSCRSGALDLKGFTNEQIMSQVEALADF